MKFVKASWGEHREGTYPGVVDTSYYGMINWWERGRIAKTYGAWANDMTGVEVRGMQPNRLDKINASHRYYEVYDARANRTEPLRHQVGARVDTTRVGRSVTPVATHGIFPARRNTLLPTRTYGSRTESRCTAEDSDTLTVRGVIGPRTTMEIHPHSSNRSTAGATRPPKENIRSNVASPWTSPSHTPLGSLFGG